MINTVMLSDKPLETKGRRFKIVKVNPKVFPGWMMEGRKYKITRGLPADVEYIDACFDFRGELLIIVFESPSWPEVRKHKGVDELEDTVPTIESL